MKFFKQLFCKHKYYIRKWYPLDKDGYKLFKDTGVITSCEKCGKYHLILPRDILGGKDE